MSVHTRIHLAAASATLIGTVVTAVLIGAFIANRQGNTVFFATLCGISIAVNIAVMISTMLFVHFNIRSTSRRIAELAKKIRAELREVGLTATAENEGRGPISDLGSMVASMTAALKRKSDRVFYLENKVKHMTASTNAPGAGPCENTSGPEQRERSENCGRAARRPRYLRRLHRGRDAEQNKRAREKNPAQPFTSSDLFDVSD